MSRVEVIDNIVIVDDGSDLLTFTVLDRPERTFFSRPPYTNFFWRRNLSEYHAKWKVIPDTRSSIRKFSWVTTDYSLKTRGLAAIHKFLENKK